MNIKSVIKAQIVNLSEARIAAADDVVSTAAAEAVVAAVEAAVGPAAGAFVYGCIRGAGGVLPLLPFTTMARLVGGKVAEAGVAAALIALTEREFRKANGAAWVARATEAATEEQWRRITELRETALAFDASRKFS
jgi:hypothetical protein